VKIIALAIAEAGFPGWRGFLNFDRNPDISFIMNPLSFLRFFLSDEIRLEIFLRFVRAQPVSGLQPDVYAVVLSTQGAALG